MLLDIKLFWILNNLAHQNIALDYLVIFFAEYSAYLLVLAFVFLMFYRKGLNKKNLILFIWGIASVVVSRLIITSGIRYFYHKPRPFLTYQVSQLIQESGYSFPSGHASFFFALSTFVYFINKKWGYWFFVVSTIMGISRIIAGVHYPIDILGGAIVGIFTGWVVYKIKDKF